MKKRMTLVTALVLACTSWIFAQGRGPQAEPAGPYITNVLPVTDNLDRAEAFYHRLLGLESANGGDPRARLVWYAQVPFLDDMYGVKGNSRNFFLHVPGSDMQLEIEQFSGATGKKLDTHIQDPGALQIILTTNNIDQLTTWLTEGGAKALSAGGKPVNITDGTGTARAILFQDFNGFFVKLVQPDGPPPKPGANGGAPTSFITGITIGVTVDDTEKTARFYHDVLGVDVKTDAPMSADAKQLDSYGLKGAQVRESMVAFPEKTPQLHFFEFKGVDRKPLHPLVADPNSVLLRIVVKDMDSVITRVKAAGGQIMNAGGTAFLNGRARWLIVTDPNGAHMQLMDRGATP
jgi:predicted enzyme related to lactoylglutathione lyase